MATHGRTSILPLIARGCVDPGSKRVAAGGMIERL